MMRRLSRTLAKRIAKSRTSIVKRRDIEPLFASVPADAKILEIGGGYNPRYTKGGGHSRVYHLDHASTADLRAKYATYATVAHLVHQIQDVDFVFDGRPIEALVPDELRFDVIYGSHTLEHQVDLIGHLQSLEKLLEPTGRVIEVIPDLRTCFDVLRYPSVTADTLVSHLRQAPVHQGKQVFDGLSRQVDLNLGRTICDADLDSVGFTNSLQSSYEAMTSAEKPGHPYVDAHAWTFTPESFRVLMMELRLLGLTRLQPTFVSAVYGNQFCAVLERGAAELSPEAAAAIEKDRLALVKAIRFR